MICFIKVVEMSLGHSVGLIFILPLKMVIRVLGACDIRGIAGSSCKNSGVRKAMI